jgi:hypothetical protein
METSTRIVDGKSWRRFYEAALFEGDSAKISARIAEAEWALALRARELFHATGDHIEEKCDLEDALYGLNALRNVARNTSIANSVKAA